MKKLRFERSCFAAVMLVFFVMVLNGCIGGSSKPSKFYLLRSIENPPDNLPTTGNRDRVAVLIGPITLPAYLDRTQMVTVAGKHELVLEEFNRWAEPLKDGFYRVLMEDLSLLLNTSDVYAYDRDGAPTEGYQVITDVTRFDSIAGGDAVLTAFWTVSGRDNSSPVMTRKSVFRKPMPSTGITGVVEAQNQILAELSREIARVIQSLQR
ncbi:MAG: membrane integrity-associated transporter subunit PqiC [Deltaproteobacteria bacterium]|nr:membrane integrity-associated transporter subunit PqiC [Deltaproteobacteria bacterium]